MSEQRRPLNGILAGPVDGPAKVRARYPDVEAVVGLHVVHRGSRFAGKITRVAADGVTVRGQSGLERVFRYLPGAFHVEGRDVSLVRATPRPSATAARAVTASGSIAVPHAPARVARAARIYVEGVHDAELVEKVWGDDLRVEGVVVERLDGLDHLESALREFRPGPGRRLGVLVDHLVDGSKEERLVRAFAGGNEHVLVTGTPFVDVWQAIRPAVAGIDAWPDIPKGQPWKEGVCAALRVGDPSTFWRALLGRVRTYADLEPALVGAVEQLIDFVTEE